MEQDRIEVTFPTKGSTTGGKPLRGESSPVTFVIPQGIVVSGSTVGGLRVRASLRSLRDFDPTAPFCRASIPSTSVEAFAVSNRKKTTSLQVDSRELAAALEDWRAMHETKPPAFDTESRRKSEGESAASTERPPLMSFSARKARAKKRADYEHAVRMKRGNG